MISLNLVDMFKQSKPGSQYLIGFPIKQKYLDNPTKAYNRTDLMNLKEVSEFLNSNSEREESTFVDISICEETIEVLETKKIPPSNAISFQLKRFGFGSVNKTAEDLIELLKKYENYPQTEINLLICAGTGAKGLNLHPIRQWLKQNKKYPFPEVNLMYPQQDSDDVRIIFIQVFPLYKKWTFKMKNHQLINMLNNNLK